MRPSHLVVGSLAVLCATLISLPFAGSVLVQGLLLGVANATAPASAGLLFAYQAEVVPEDQQGTTTSTIGLLASIGAPAGPIVAGVVAAAAGVRAAEVVLAVLMALGCVVVTRPVGLRMLDRAMRKTLKEEAPEASVAAAGPVDRAAAGA